MKAPIHLVSADWAQAIYTKVRDGGTPTAEEFMRLQAAFDLDMLNQGLQRTSEMIIGLGEDGVVYLTAEDFLQVAGHA